MLTTSIIKYISYLLWQIEMDSYTWQKTFSQELSEYILYLIKYYNRGRSVY